jgi:hypothetical protein
MSKAASRQTIKKDDFLSVASAKVAFHAPVPPTITEIEENNEEYEGERLIDTNNNTNNNANSNTKDAPGFHPLNIPVLKDIMNKKVQKMAARQTMLQNQAILLKQQQHFKLGNLERSTTSLKSVES